MPGGDRRLRLPWISWGSALLAALALKRFYSHASAEDLGWVLGPTASVVGWLRGEELALRPGAGWGPPDGAYLIAPACAGVNFLIAAFVAAVLGFSHRLGSRRERACGWLASLAGAYALTIAVDALRIAGAVDLYRAELPWACLTPERVHRLWGIAVYLGALWALGWGLDALASRREQRAAPRDAAGPLRGLGLLAVPLIYLGVTIGAPLADGAWRRGGGAFVEHAATVSLATGLALASLAGLIMARRRARGPASPDRAGPRAPRGPR